MTCLYCGKLIKKNNLKIMYKVEVEFSMNNNGKKKVLTSF